MDYDVKEVIYEIANHIYIIPTLITQLVDLKHNLKLQNHQPAYRVKQNLLNNSCLYQVYIYPNSFLPVRKTGKMTQIYHILPLLCISVAFLILNTSAYLDDEYYCRRNTTDSQVCHRCLEPEVEGGCAKNEEDKGKCACNNIAVYDGYRGWYRNKVS